jgi:Flp pilus assembly protein TadD
MVQTFGRLLAGLIILLALAGCEDPIDPEEELKLQELLAREPASLDEIRKDIAEGSYSAADLKLVDRINQVPDDYAAAFIHGELLLGMGRGSDAMSRFLLASQSDELRAQALQGLGLALIKIAGPHEAPRVNLEEAISLDPTLWRAHNGLGQVYDSDKEWAKAEAAYLKAIELQPSNPILYSNLGMSYLLQQRYDDATARFREALQLDPDLVVARTNLRLSYASQGKYVQALAGVADRDMPDALNDVGFLAMIRGDFDAAEAYLTRALETSPAYHRKAASNLKRLEEMRLLQAESDAEAQAGSESDAPQ